MEENNRKGPGVFYAVVGVATLVVAIIGATFAYFSASAENTGDPITGGTNNDLASALSLKVKEVTWSDTGVTSHNLVPATFSSATTGTLAVNDIKGAINAKCVNSGYTGCHLWKIEANTIQTIANASVLLDLSVDANVKTNWRYAIFTAESFIEGYTNISPVASAIVSQGDLSDGVTAFDMHNNTSMNAGTADTNPSNTYYLLVWLNNVASSQNQTTSETGTYTGTVTMNAAGGKVSATFTAAQ